eukprot:scaffold2908_cov257-Pinguiococcus_pyrenoidosus.AAC.37
MTYRRAFLKRFAGRAHRNAISLCGLQSSLDPMVVGEERSSGMPFDLLDPKLITDRASSPFWT